MKTLSDAFEHTPQDIYFAEQALAKALPNVEEAANGKPLKQAISSHLEETKGHIKMLEDVFKSIGKEAKGKKCDAMAGLIKEVEGIAKEATGTAKNAALIGACQAVEHYEIARYGTLREWAKVLGHSEAHDLLTEILDQEKAANSKLTDLAVSEINEV
tara:strand:+ start:25635 stop:26108 length:474 start_codon:yes stop_codon:yes gene_type:complete